MESRAKLFGHPIHQALVVLPLGLLAGAIVFDIAHLVTNTARWAEIAYWMIGLGVLCGLLTAVFGAIDWMAIPANTRAKSVGIVHASLMVSAVVLFAVSWFLRRPAPLDPHWIAHALAFGGGVIALIGAWFGGELVDRLGVGVSDGAHLNAPSSLTNQPANPLPLRQNV